MLERLGSAVARRRGLVLAVWALLVVAGAVLGGAVFDRTQDVADAPAGSEAALADARLSELDPSGETVTAVLTGTDFYDPALVQQATDVMWQVRQIPGVVEVTDAYTGGGLVGDDGTSSLVVVELDPALGTDAALATADDVAQTLRTLTGVDVLVGGELLAERAFVDRSLTAAAIGESVAIVVLLAVLVVVLGGLRAGALPVLAALGTIAAALLALTGVIGLVPVNEFAVNVVTLLGLGLTVDYALLVLWRFREERERAPGTDVAQLVGRAVATAGRAVLVSGTAVAIALGGLLLLGDPLLSGMAIGGAVVVLVATLAGLTLVPALVATWHRHLPARGVRTWSRPWGQRVADPTQAPGTAPGVVPGGRVPDGAAPLGLLARLARVAQRRAPLVTVLATVGMLVLAAPLGSLTLGSSGVASLPADAEGRRTHDAMTTGFSDLGVAPVTVIVDGPWDDPDVGAFLDQATVVPGVTDADLDADITDPTVTVVELTPDGDATGATAQQVVRDVRALRDTSDLPFTVAVAGPAADVVDTQAHLAQRLPVALGVVVTATFLLLLALTRSVVVPIKALLLNALTIAATLGALTALFGWGWGENLLGFDSWGALDVTTPLLLCLLVFGLSMDYEVFLLARITEEWRHRDPADDPRVANDRAVLRGITTTGPVVTTAAVAITIVFLGFAVGDVVALKEVGVGMALAVVLDVTVVRGLLLPATMTLLGRWNWWPGSGSGAVSGSGSAGSGSGVGSAVAGSGAGSAGAGRVYHPPTTGALPAVPSSPATTRPTPADPAPSASASPSGAK
ncbi:MMPL family transporter [Cellulosimicrobium marinum]|uniref:MMPL family transporter n=1 Tax=Cellulosimicrobium marinum TaxID=1638992 RepID=UPI001E5D552C|nr:MMPL family transporter [Cellulosimicrobium marinum]MCB7135868.1 MMPL family transporter [Cellulosimicrobium marinum]